MKSFERKRIKSNSHFQYFEIIAADNSKQIKKIQMCGKDENFE